MRYFVFILLLIATAASAQTTVVTTTTAPAGQPLPVTETAPVVVVPGATPLNVTVTNPGQVTIPNPLPVTTTNPTVIPNPLPVTVINPPSALPSPLPVTETAPVTVIPGAAPLNVTVTNPSAAIPNPLPVTVTNQLTLPAGGATAANQNATAPGTAATGAQAVQGVPGGVPVGVTLSSPVTDLPGLTGGATGGKAVGIIVPNQSLPINVTTTGAAQIIPAVAGLAIYVTEINYTMGAAGTLKFVYGTGINCATGQGAVTGTYTYAAAGVGMADSVFWSIPSGNALCVVSSVAAGPGGSVSFAQF